MKPKSTKGGPRPGAGRPRIPGAKLWRVLVTDAERDRLKAVLRDLRTQKKAPRHEAEGRG